MEDADRAAWLAGRLRAVAVELERSLPSGEWRGPSELQCRLRILEARDDLHRVSRLLDNVAESSRP